MKVNDACEAEKMEQQQHTQANILDFRQQENQKSNYLLNLRKAIYC